jgi:hypothetical protein
MSVYPPPSLSLASRLIDDTLSSRGQLELCAARSYLHPNGFTKVLLSSSPTAGSIRLHHWTEPSEDDDIHSHRWPFSSRILRGRFREAVYRVDVLDTGQQFLRYRYSRQRSQGRLIEPSAIWLSEIASYPVAAPSWIARNERVFHRLSCVDPGGGLTLVHTRPPVAGYSYVVRRHGETTVVRGSRPLRLAEVASVLEELACLEVGDEAA